MKKEGLTKLQKYISEKYVLKENASYEEKGDYHCLFYAPKQYQNENEILEYALDNPNITLRDLSSYWDSITPDGLPPCASEWEDDDDETDQLRSLNDDVIMEERDQPRDKDGRFASTGSIRRKKGGPRYAPSSLRNKTGIQVSPKKYAKLCGTFNTNFPGLKPSDGTRTIFDSNYYYNSSADGY